MANATEKFNSITQKMNKITEELTKNIDLSETLLVTTEELSDVAENIRPKLPNPPNPPVSRIPETLGDTEILNTEFRPVSEIAAQIVDVSSMISDFNYMRNSLRETTNNTKRVLESVTEDLLMADGEDSRAALIMAYSELNKAQIENIKLFMQSYKEVSTILVNFTKVKSADAQGPKAVNNYTTNVLNIEETSAASIVARLNKRDPE